VMKWDFENEIPTNFNFVTFLFTFLGNFTMVGGRHSQNGWHASAHVGSVWKSLCSQKPNTPTTLKHIPNTS
jgi:hypothetical protein